MARIPEGWQLVPKAPTDEMVRSIFCFPPGERRYNGTPSRETEVVNTDTSLAIYRTMLAAAPPPPAAVTEEQVAKAICCPTGCERPEDCWEKHKRHNEQTVRAVLALFNPRP